MVLQFSSYRDSLNNLASKVPCVDALFSLSEVTYVASKWFSRYNFLPILNWMHGLNENAYLLNCASFIMVMILIQLNFSQSKFKSLLKNVRMHIKHLMGKEG
jgi:hypothetical protein